MDRGIWQTTIYRGHKNWTQLKTQHFLVLRQLHAKIQKEMFSFSISEQKKKKKKERKKDAVNDEITPTDVNRIR